MTILFRGLESANIKFGKKAKAHILIAESGTSEEEKFKMERLVIDAPDEEKENSLKTIWFVFTMAERKTKTKIALISLNKRPPEGEGPNEEGVKEGEGHQASQHARKTDRENATIVEKPIT